MRQKVQKKPSIQLYLGACRNCDYRSKEDGIKYEDIEGDLGRDEEILILCKRAHGWAGVKNDAHSPEECPFHPNRKINYAARSVRTIHFKTGG